MSGRAGVVAVIVVLGCGKAKLRGRHPARELYIGNLFRAHLLLAEALEPRAIYVASAQYGLVGIDDELDWYELTVKDFGREALGDWRRGIAGRVDELAGERELVVVLAGSDYASWVDGCHRRIAQPLAGMMVGERLSFVAKTVGAQ